MQNFPQYSGKKVLIWGLGLNDGGLGMVDFFVSQGAIVTITDGKTEEQLKPTLEKLSAYKDKIVLHLGGHIKEDFTDNDIIIRNPAIKPDNEFLKLAKDSGKTIEMEMSLFHKLSPCPTIGITGTRGKSTTTTLIYLFLHQQYGEKIMLGGNIGKSAIRELPSLNKDNIAVLELSSFQLDAMGDTQVAPHIAVLTNIFQDHLNWHKDLQDYQRAKKNIFRFQDANDFAVINLDNETTSAIVQNEKDTVKGKLITFSIYDKNADYYLEIDGEKKSVYEHRQKLMDLPKMHIDGLHNYSNIIGAIATARVYKVTTDSISKVLSDFKGVAGREQLIRELNGIRFYNDTTGTSLEAMLAALDRFGPANKGKIIFISGGMDKELDYTKIKEKMIKYLKSLVLLEGTASEKMANIIGDEIEVHKYYGVFKDAIEKAYSLAQSGDMIMLCPGATSFNMFANEFDRGRQYDDIVIHLK